MGSVNDISLNEFSKFRYLEARYLHGHGTGESGTKPKQKASDKSRTASNWRQTDPCRLGTTENVRRKHPCVNTGTFARTAEDPTARLIVLEAKQAALEQ